MYIQNLAFGPCPRKFFTVRAANERGGLNQIFHVRWEFIDGSVVELFQFSKGLFVVVSDKVDGNSLSTKSTRSTNSVKVVFRVSGQVVVDDQRDLMNIDTSSQQISGNQHSGRTSSEFIQNNISFFLVNVSVLKRY
jgi:hypothetical protein